MTVCNVKDVTSTSAHQTSRHATASQESDANTSLEWASDHQSFGGNGFFCTVIVLKSEIRPIITHCHSLVIAKNEADLGYSRQMTVFLLLLCLLLNWWSCKATKRCMLSILSCFWFTQFDWERSRHWHLLDVIRKSMSSLCWPGSSRRLRIRTLAESFPSIWLLGFGRGPGSPFWK